MTLGLGMVVHNEAQRIGPLLDYCSTFTDCMLVIDQDSTDNTAEIALAHGAQVIHDQCHGFADPSRPKLIEHLPTEWVLMLDADEHPTTRFRLDIPDLMQTRGVYCPRENLIGDCYYSTDTHYRLFPKNNVALSTTLHGKHHPVDHHGVVTLEYVALEHHKSWVEQLTDDESYDRLGQQDHKYLDLARELNVTGAELDAMSRAERLKLGFP